MPTAVIDLDATMERASRALVEMDYLGCETLCLEALTAAREAGDWPYYSRILLPLQEARRQRRMIACEAGVTRDDPELQRGVMVLTRAFSHADAARIEQQARQAGRFVEVLLVTAAGSKRWRVESFAGPLTRVQVAAPTDGLTVPWFLHASERLGDKAIAQVRAPLGTPDRVLALEAALAVVTDHEKLHQRLGDAARALFGRGAY